MARRKAYENIIDITGNMDYNRLEQNINELANRFKFIEKIPLGKSYLGKNINLLKIGNGEHKVIYIGAHHGMEWITSMILMRFAEDFCKGYIFNEKLYKYDPEYILQTRTIYIVPMLNPDGVDFVINGISEENPVYARLMQMNDGSADFSTWQANGRGVDLNHNYDADFNILKSIEIEQGIMEPCSTRYGGEYAESEPEVSALTSFIRLEGDIKLLAALHTQGEVIYWRYKNIHINKAKMLAELISKSSGYELEDPDEEIASYGGCKDWFISVFKRPGFTIECGKGVNPLPLSDFIKIYTDISESLALLLMN